MYIQTYINVYKHTQRTLYGEQWQMTRIYNNDGNNDKNHIEKFIGSSINWRGKNEEKCRKFQLRIHHQYFTAFHCRWQFELILCTFVRYHHFRYFFARTLKHTHTQRITSNRLFLPFIYELFCGIDFFDVIVMENFIWSMWLLT